MQADRLHPAHESGASVTLSPNAQILRKAHTVVGVGELVCLGYLWFCGIAHRRDRRLKVAVTVLLGEGIALVAAKGWFGPRLARVAVPVFTTFAGLGLATVVARPPRETKRPEGGSPTTSGVSDSYTD